jgi:hypothetical protein
MILGAQPAPLVKQEGMTQERQRQTQIPPLRYGMTRGPQAAE